MTSNAHTKHAKLARPALGRYGRHEWAILGTSCNDIQQLAQTLIAAFSDRYRCAYLDADHTSTDADATPQGMLAAGAKWEFTEQQHSRELRFGGQLGTHQLRGLFNEADMILVNGNHHEAAAQIVVIDPIKENSLRKRLAQLSDVRLILLASPGTQVFDFVENALPDPAAVPRLSLDDHAGIQDFFEKTMSQNIPALNGLVLAGGRSMRMGRDKGGIIWHGKPQREFMAELLGPFCSEVFISCRSGQELELATARPVLPDAFSELGPFGALLSAFRAQPDKAWLVVACDLPLLDAATLEFLVQHRRPGSVATAFESPGDTMPEPLITIWEPKAYAILLSFLAQGYSCPRKVLLHSDTKILKAPHPAALTNVNTPEDIQQLGFSI